MSTDSTRAIRIVTRDPRTRRLVTVVARETAARTGEVYLWAAGQVPNSHRRTPTFRSAVRTAEGIADLLVRRDGWQIIARYDGE